MVIRRLVYVMARVKHLASNMYQGYPRVVFGKSEPDEGYSSKYHLPLVILQC